MDAKNLRNELKLKYIGQHMKFASLWMDSYKFIKCSIRPYTIMGIKAVPLCEANNSSMGIISLRPENKGDVVIVQGMYDSPDNAILGLGEWLAKHTKGTMKLFPVFSDEQDIPKLDLKCCIGFADYELKECLRNCYKRNTSRFAKYAKTKR